MTLPDLVDVAIIGAGPAGLSAARHLAEAGIASVHVLEREAEAGGIPRHCLHSPFGLREYGRPMTGPAYARLNLRRALGAGAQVHTRVTVTTLGPGGALELSTPDGVHQLQARAVILATGARETSRAARLIGGTKPGGVLTPGALQPLVHVNGARPFRAPLILGTELVSFSALLTCRSAGAKPVAMVDPGPRIRARWPAPLLPRLLGIPVLTGTELLAIHGGSQVIGATLRDATGKAREIACDGVVITGGFRPESALLAGSGCDKDPRSLGPVVDQYARLTDPAYFACGNALRGVETAGACWHEGRSVARVVTLALLDGLPDPQATRTIPADTPEAPGALAYALPQRLAPDTAPPALPHMQLRVTRDYSGPLTLGRDQGQLHARPDRRIHRPLPRLP